jgi:hypothetical protein
MNLLKCSFSCLRLVDECIDVGTSWACVDHIRSIAHAYFYISIESSSPKPIITISVTMLRGAANVGHNKDKRVESCQNVTF